MTITFILLAVATILLATGINTALQLRDARRRVRRLRIDLDLTQIKMEAEKEHSESRRRSFWERYREYRQEVAADPDLQREEREDLDDLYPAQLEDGAAYTEDERDVMEYLVNAWNRYAGLPKEHPDDVNDFKDGIHTLQRIILANIALRNGRRPA